MNGFIWNAVGYWEYLFIVSVFVVGMAIVSVLMGCVTIKSVIRCIDGDDTWCESQREGESQGKSCEITKRIVRAIKVSVLLLVMFIGYVLSVGFNAANKEVILSQDACTRDKIDKNLSLKESEYISNYEVAKLAKACQKEEEDRKGEEKNKREKEEKEKTRISQLEWLRSEKEK